MLDQAFLEWLRATTEARWADPTLRDAGRMGLGEPTWQPNTRWRGGLTDSDLRILEAMFSFRLPGAYRRFLAALHTPDPALAAVQSRAGRLIRVEGRLFTDWTGPTTPLIAALEAPLDGVLRGVALGRWHPSWGERPGDERERARRVRRLAAAGPRLVPVAGHRYLVAAPGADDGPVIAVHGADAALFAPDLRGTLLRELGVADPDRPAAADADEDGGTLANPAAAAASNARIPFWSDVIDGLAWLPTGAAAQT